MANKKKMHVFTNFANSMDGKIASFKREDVKPSKADRALMDFHRSRADVILNGAGTVRAHRFAFTIRNPKLVQSRIKQGKAEHPANAVISSSLNLNPKWKYFQNASTHKILIVPENISQAKLKPFQKTCSVIYYKTSKPMIPQLLKAFQKLGYYSILIEGGGKMMFPWVKADCIDEWNITLSPKVIGGSDSPTMVEGAGLLPKQIRYYKLKKVKKVKDDLFLQYIKIKK